VGVGHPRAQTRILGEKPALVATSLSAQLSLAT
jgi:hypothetical protein